MKKYLFKIDIRLEYSNVAAESGEEALTKIKKLVDDLHQIDILRPYTGNLCCSQQEHGDLIENWSTHHLRIKEEK